MTPELESTLRALISELLRANETVNLTAIRDPDDAWTRHVLDSLQGLETDLFDATPQCIDVGAGAGFPGLPLAMARPKSRWTFLEATGKKCRFIENTSAHFGLNARVLNARAEDAAHLVEWRERFHVATARAVGSLPEVLELCLPFVRLQGHVLLWRGKDAPSEAQAAKRALKLLGGELRSVQPYQLPNSDGAFHLVRAQKVAPTPKMYPRRVGLPKSEPL